MNKVKINYKIFNRGDLIMLSKDLLEALNDQMNHEYFDSCLYGNGAYCDDASYEGFANFYIQQAKEERFHGKNL